MTTLDRLFEMWQPTRTGKLRTKISNLDHYRLHIRPAFGRREVTSITRADVAGFFGLLSTDHSARTVRNVGTTLSQILDYAVDADLIPINPAIGVKRPRVPKMRPDNVLAPEQVNEMAELHGDGGHVTIALAWTGVRWSELVGLEVADFQINPRPMLKVRRQVQRIPGHGVVTTSPKSHAARNVPVPDPAVQTFVNSTRGKSRTDPIFTSPAGGTLNASNWRRQVDWTGALREMNLVGFRPHDLRHTAASYWIACGADIKTIQSILGHASGEMTLDVYGHLLDQGLVEATQRINDWARSVTNTA